MLRNLKRFAWIGCLALGIQTTLGFALLGPNNEPWQVPEIGYNPLPIDAQNSAPKNIGEEYRRNTPVLYYTFDSSFLEFFGTHGVASVEAAMDMFNSLTNVSSYSRELTEFPVSSTRENYRASALGLTDIKSYVMSLMIEQLGLADSIRYVWELHSRINTGPDPCPADMLYGVIKRNWDFLPSPVNQYQSSSYVNNVLYSFYIREFCEGDPPLAYAWEFPVDPLDVSSIPVSSWLNLGMTEVSSLASFDGLFLTGLTRDDIGGLRYLLRTNNFNWESTAANALGLFTNTTPELYYSSNLTLFAEQALTNAPGVLAGLYPGITILSSSNWFETVWITNQVSYYTNTPWTPAYAATNLVTIPVATLEVRQYWDHIFDNLRLVVYTNGAWAAIPINSLSGLKGYGFLTVQTEQVGVGTSPYTPAGSFSQTTNVTTRTFSTNQVVGEFLILPTNICDITLLSTALTFTNRYTNIITSVTQDVTISNAVSGATNYVQSYTLSHITYSTNHAFVALPIQCLGSNVVLAGGIERISFVRRDYDSLLGRFFTPFTNTYTMQIVTNNTIRPLRVIQPITAPDIVFSATDLEPGPDSEPGGSTAARSLLFNTNGLAFYPGNYGPGTIESPVSVTLNKVGESYAASGNFGAFQRDIAEDSLAVLMRWGSFDATTNVPVVYPNGTSIENLEQLIFFQMGPDLLPDAIVGLAYGESSPTFTAPGAQAPLKWTLAPGSSPLPPGITLSQDGTLSGRPTFTGTYGFTIRVEDATGRTADRGYTLRVKRF